MVGEQQDDCIRYKAEHSQEPNRESQSDHNCFGLVYCEENCEKAT
jgi:hypothetical protein